MSSWKLLCTMGMLFLFGCTSFGEADRSARQAAQATYQRVIALKAELRRKIDAEQIYYGEAVETLTKSRERFQYTEMRRSVLAEAREQADHLREKPEDISTEYLVEKLIANADHLVGSVQAGMEEQRKQRAAMEETIQKLSVLNDKYTALERTLLELSIPTGKRDRIQDVGGFIVEMVKHYERIREEQKAERQGTQPGEGE